MSGKELPGLLPCPFCGSDGVMLTNSCHLLFWSVKCCSCRARGPETHAAAIGEEERMHAVDIAKQNAVEGWNRNRRTPEVIREWMEKEEEKYE